MANADAAADEQRETRCKRGKAETAALNEHKTERPCPKYDQCINVSYTERPVTRGGGRREKRPQGL